MPAIYSTSTKEGVDINNVFILDTATMEYPGPPFSPGEKAWGTDGSEWVFCTSSVTITAGSAVLISSVPGSWSVAMLGGSTLNPTANATGMLVGVVGGSQGSMFVPAPSGTQRGAYFWVQRAGNCPHLRTLASTAKLSQLHGTATLAGALGSAGGGVGTTYQVNGIVVSQATGSLAGPNTAVLNYPVVGNSS
jgi:hypothetical protein